MTKRPLILDLFCGAGLAADGYHAAGFDTVGVDIDPQPDYPGRFIQADALAVLADLESYDLGDVVAIHASPPCQAFTTMSNRDRGHRSTAADDNNVDLLTPTLKRLPELGLPWIVENVPGARRVMPKGFVTLTGGTFGLNVHRPRLFAASFPLTAPPKSPAPRPAIGVYGARPDGRLLWTRKDGTEQRAAKSVEEARWAMGVNRPIPWRGVAEGFPPAYTEYLGRQLRTELGGAEHPAKYSEKILEVLRPIVAELPGPILDPFAGTGRIHDLGRDDTYGIEIEPEWAAMHDRTLCGDATALPFGDATIGSIVTSPTYGNRMADTYDGRDGSKRHTYRIALGRELAPTNTGGMQWGDQYRETHVAAYREAFRVLKPDGRLVVNVSDHVRKGEVVPVVLWHARAIRDAGFDPVPGGWLYVKTPRMRNGANGDLRVPGEAVIVFAKSIKSVVYPFRTEKSPAEYAE